MDFHKVNRERLNKLIETEFLTLAILSDFAGGQKRAEIRNILSQMCPLNWTETKIEKIYLSRESSDESYSGVSGTVIIKLVYR